MNILKYRALVEIHLPRNEEELNRLLEMQKNKQDLPPISERDYVTYQEGEYIDYVPETSIKSLMHQKFIEQVEVDELEVSK